MILRALGLHPVKTCKGQGRGTVKRESSTPLSCECRSYLNKSLDFPRKDYARWRMPIRRLASEANLDMWFAEERSWLMVRSKHLKTALLQEVGKESTLELMGGFARWTFQRDRVKNWDLSGFKDIFQVLD